MLKSGRPLAIAAAASLVVMAVTTATVSAQTAIARHAPAGSTVELVLNGVKAGTGTADDKGDAKIPFTLAGGPKAEMDATVHVDICTDIRRILVAERNQTPPPPEAGCVRKDVLGVFLIRRVTNLVVETGAPNATVFLRQGPVDLNAKGPIALWSDTPVGLVVSGGAGLGWFRDALDLQCGNASACNGGDSRTDYVASATWWIGPFIGIEGAYVKPAGINASGTGSNYEFSSVQSTWIGAINGKGSIPAHRVRIYGQGGTNYSRAKFSTTQTITNVGTQKIELKTGGWGWQIGGGLEVWVKPPFGVFGEFNRFHLKGEGIEGGHGSLDDWFTTALFGMRVKIGG
jgi:hypothetical protein